MNREVLLYELRTLRNAGRKADAILEARTRHEKRLAYLNANHQEKEIAACIDRLLALDPSSALAAAASLEEKYLPYHHGVNIIFLYRQRNFSSFNEQKSAG